jgi:hypothetical protein
MSYANTGRLSPNQYKKSDKQPDHKGSITLERSLVKQLLEESEDEVVIKISGWNRSGQYGDFISLAYDSYKKQEETPKPKAPPPAEEDIPF